MRMMVFGHQRSQQREIVVLAPRSPKLAALTSLPYGAFPYSGPSPRSSLASAAGGGACGLRRPVLRERVDHALDVRGRLLSGLALVLNRIHIKALTFFCIGHVTFINRPQVDTCVLNYIYMCIKNLSFKKHSNSFYNSASFRLKRNLCFLRQRSLFPPRPLWPRTPSNSCWRSS